MHTPGGKSLFKLKSGVTGAAYISADFQHRLWLSRTWGPGARYVAIVGLNPSTADPQMDDPTLLRDTFFAQSWGYDGLFKINLATYRATDPRRLLVAPQLNHEDAAHCVGRIVQRCSRVVLAWGAVHPRLQYLETQMLSFLDSQKPDLWCLGRTQKGHPRHTLYLKGITPLEKFTLR